MLLRDKKDSSGLYHYIKWDLGNYHLPLGTYLAISYELEGKRRSECKCNENRSGVVTNTSCNFLRHTLTNRTKEICDSWFATFLTHCINQLKY